MIFTAPEFLSELFRTIIVMTIIGSIVALLILLIKPLVRHRLPKSAQYYLWLVVIAVLLVPVSRIIELPTGTGLGFSTIHDVVERTVISTDEARNRQMVSVPAMSNVPNFTLPAAEPLLPSESIPEISPGLFARVSTAIMLIYPWVALIVMLFAVVGYIRFTMKVRRFNIRAGRIERTMLKELVESNNIRRSPRLYRNTFAATPMLIGLFKPVIILPDKEYSETQLHSILLHEILHFRRLDIVIKWLSLFACAVHWFNPIVWIARREISRACELSCDEAVIRNMDIHAKQNYGETLICVAADSRTPLTVLSTTMCEEKRELKERLTSIMKSRRYTKLAVLASSFVFLAVTLVACTLGTGTSTDGGNSNYTNILAANPNTNTTEFMGNEVESGSVHKLYAAEYIRNWAESFGGDFFSVTSTSAGNFEQIMEFDNLLENPLELWRLDFYFQLAEGPVAIEEGYSNFDRLTIVWADDGEWIVEAAATDPQGGGHYLAFERIGENVRFLGAFEEHGQRDVSTRDAAENTLRQWLEQERIVVPSDVRNIEYGTPMTFAEGYIRNWTESFGGDFFIVTDTRIVNLEQVMVFDQFLENRVELWRLDFHFQLDEGIPIEEGYSNFDRLNIEWADDGDWIAAATATDPHGSGHYLVFERINGYVRFLGSFYEHWQMDVSTRDAAEDTIRHLLERESILNP